jgi:glycosyltransferase involved in cell wall biosynthesis
VSFRPAAQGPGDDGPLRVVFVGTLDLRKGFVYLLNAAMRLGDGVSVELVGGSVDRCTRRLLESCRARANAGVAPGDPRAAFRRAELAVLPTLEDGSPFAAAEAMASGLPLVVTDCCGAAEWVAPGETGWIVPGRDIDALAAALDDARRRRADLRGMGRAARVATEQRADASICDPLAGEWVLRGFRL